MLNVEQWIYSTLRRSSREENRRAGLLTLIDVALIFWGVLYTLLYCFLLDVPQLGIVVGTATAGALLVPAVHRATGSCFIAAQCLVLLLASALLGVAYLTGGLRSPALAWLVLVPVVSTMMSGIRSGSFWLLAVALIVSGIFVAERQGHPFQQLLGPHKLTFLYANALVGLVIATFLFVWIYETHRKMAIAELEYEAAHDHLTKTCNRVTVIEFLKRELASVKVGQQPLAALMLDVDHFKQVNDRHGHLTGDHVLRQVVSRLHCLLPEKAEIGRYGGEEFLIVLPGCDVSRAAHIAEQLREDVEATPVRSDGREIPVTVSLGVADAPSAATAEDILRFADKALYRAKRSGRNCVCLYEQRGNADEPKPATRRPDGCELAWADYPLQNELSRHEVAT